MTTPSIKPTIGRRVWFRPGAQFLERNPTVTQLGPGQPMDAGIVYVHHDHMVNLAVCDHVGRTHMVPSVPLLAGQWEPSDTDYAVCEWMPYQKGQAAKAEAAVKAMEAADLVAVPRGLIGAACSAIDKQRDAPQVLAELRRHTTGDLSIEAEIQAKGLTAPRITQADIEANIASEFYINPHEAALDAERLHFLADDHADQEVRGKVATIHERMSVMSLSALRAEVDELMAIPGQCTKPLRLLTFCVLVLRNGFTVTGESACASPENFDAAIGRKIARQNAEQKIWLLLGFRLRDQLAAHGAQ